MNDVGRSLLRELLHRYQMIAICADKTNHLLYEKVYRETKAKERSRSETSHA